MEDITKALKRKRVAGSTAGGSRASSAETALKKRLATERETIPPPPKNDDEEDSTPCAATGQPNPVNVPVKAAPSVPANLKNFSALKQTKAKPAPKKPAVQPEEEQEPSGPQKKVKKVSKYAKIYACPLCPTKFKSSQQRYIHCGLDHLVYIPMVEGAPQSATSGHELILVQMVRKFHHKDTGVPTFEWKGTLEHKAFWSVRRNAEKQNKEYCQGYVWKRLHDDDHIPTLITPISVEQQAEFHGEQDIRVVHDGRVLHTRLPPHAKGNSWNTWRNSKQKGWFSGGSNRKPVSPKSKSKPASGARGSNERPPDDTVIAVPDDGEAIPEPTAEVSKRIDNEIDKAEKAVETRIEQELTAPFEFPAPVQPPHVDDPAHRPTQAVTLQQSYNMINESWQCLAQHTYGSQYAASILEARVLSLEQASPKLMTEIIKRVTHVYKKLNENDTTLGGQLNILKEDVSLFMSQLDDVKAAADRVKKNTVERMAVYETTQQMHKEQIDVMKNQIKSFEEVIRLLYDTFDKQTTGASSEATPAQSK